MENIQMVDLKGQYQRLKGAIDQSIQECLDSARFIGGAPVTSFEESLRDYLGSQYLISCANGTDALQLALMACDLEQGDEVIVPAFTYVATAEVIGLLNLKPVMIDVDPDNFNIDVDMIEELITPKTKAIVPVHLYGQCSDMDSIMEIAKAHNLMVIEDNAQSIGGTYKGNRKTGTIGHIGCTSFFPSKNLGCYGDGGAICTNDEKLAGVMRMTAKHGQIKKYYHEIIGVNSRLDSLQANILSVKLKELDDFVSRRQAVASQYDELLGNIPELQTPRRVDYSDHVFHQYTLRVKNGKRDQLSAHLKENGVPSMIYYPLPLYDQNAFKPYHDGRKLEVTEQLCHEVISLPIHTEMPQNHIDYITDSVHKFFK